MRKYVGQLSVVVIALIIMFVPLTVRATAAASPTINDFSIPTSGAEPEGITAGSDGALWFTEAVGNKIGRITTAGTITEYPIPTSDSHPRTITNGSDGALWFAELFGNNIGRISTSGTITEYSIPSTDSFPTNITAGPDGALWFTAQSNDNGVYGYSIIRMTVSGAFTEYPVTPFNTNTGITDIITGSDGALWFTENYNPGGSCSYSQHSINQITISGIITYHELPSGCSSLIRTTVGSDGAFWITESSNSDNYSIGRYTVSNGVTTYPIPTLGAVPTGITAGPDNALWFAESGSSKVGRIDTAGDITEYTPPTAGSEPYEIVNGPDDNLWLTEPGSNEIGKLNPTPAPPTPTNLRSSSPARYPNLSWSSVSGATSYNVYRNGTNISSSSTVSYTDNAAPEGTDTYYVTAVNSAGESIPSSNVTVLVDRTAPTITYTVSPAPNSSGWNNSPVTVTFNCSDNAGGSGIASCSSPQTESADGTYVLTGAATDNAGNTSSVTVTINLDQTPPTLGIPAWTNNPMTASQSTTVTVPVSDNFSGVAKGEYYLGSADPGQGNGTAMIFSNGNLTTSFSNQTPGIYTINFRAEDNVGDWSPITIDYLVVYDTTKTSADGHSGDIEPIYGTDILPGLIQTGQKDKEHFAFTVKYKNGQLDPNSTIHFDYKTGSNCNNPNKATNCHETTIDASSITWMVINGTNNSVATIQGTATFTIDGTTTTNPFRVITTDGSLLNPQTTDHFELDIYTPNANPNTAQPIYHLSDPLAKGNVVVKAQ